MSSSVERALEKLRNAQRAPAKPVAQVAREGAESRPNTPASGATGRFPLPDGANARPRIEFDLAALREAGLYAHESRILADQYRVIKRPLLKKAADSSVELHNRNLIAVTSALAGEGKTFTSINLALSLTAEKDWRVLLIDADPHNPQLSRLLGAESEAGLLNLLKDKQTSIASHVMPTTIEGLSVLPMGEGDDHSAELLASSRMTRICDELSKVESNCIVIFDTSPLLLTTESAIVCAHTGQILVVVRSDRTAQHDVLRALEKLDETKAVGFVLNGTDRSAESNPYGGYGSSYPYQQASGTDGR